MRLANIESRPEPAPMRMPVANEASPDLEEVREMVAALQDPSKAAPGGLETLVLDVIDEKEQREEEARRLRREEVMQERLAQRVARLGEELGLSPYQEQEMLTVLTTESAKRDACFTEMRETGAWDRDAMREAMGELRQETMTSLGTVLTPDQLQRYEESEGDRGFGRGGFGGGRRNRDGGGGGGGGEGGNGGGGGGRNRGGN